MSYKEIDFILNSNYSNTAQIILIKSLRLPKDWQWKREWIMNFFKLTDHQWRNISKELKDAGNLKHHYRQEEGKIVKEIVITFRLDEFQQDESICAEIPRLDDHRLDGEQRIYSTSTRVIPKALAESTFDDHRLDGEQQDGEPHQKLWDNIPAELRELNQWVYWRYDKIDDKDTKVPYCTKTKKAKTNDSKTWLNFVGYLESALQSPKFFSGSFNFTITQWWRATFFIDKMHPIHIFVSIITNFRFYDSTLSNKFVVSTPIRKYLFGQFIFTIILEVFRVWSGRFWFG